MKQPWFHKRRPDRGEGIGWHPTSREGWWSLGLFCLFVVLLGLIVPRLFPQPWGSMLFVILVGCIALIYTRVMQAHDDG